MNNYFVKFDIEGEGRLLGGADILTNPAPVRWGCAPVLIQSTLKPGKIKVMASVLIEGSQMPVSAELEFESKSAILPLIYDKNDAASIPKNAITHERTSVSKTEAEREIERLQRELNSIKLKEVEKQQQEFGERK